MNQTKEILTLLKERYEDIEYYDSIIEIIESKINDAPDISIEGCKSLLEGISKFTLKQLDAGYDGKNIDSLDFQPLFKKALAKISDHTDCIEEDFVNRACSMIHMLGEIRNKRGDISHGKLAPKEIISDQRFSNLVMQMTDGLASYILVCFSQITIQKELLFGDNPEFNEMLDENNSIPGISYSKALFDQDIEAYKQELINYNDSLETAESDV